MDKPPLARGQGRWLPEPDVRLDDIMIPTVLARRVAIAYAERVVAGICNDQGCNCDEMKPDANGIFEFQPCTAHRTLAALREMLDSRPQETHG